MSPLPKQIEPNVGKSKDGIELNSMISIRMSFRSAYSMGLWKSPALVYALERGWHRSNEPTYAREQSTAQKPNPSETRHTLGQINIGAHET